MTPPGASGPAHRVSRSKYHPTLSDEDRIRLALTRFTLTNQRRLPRIGEIAKKVGFPLATVSRAISRAFRDGLVEVRRLEPRRVRSLEDSLLQDFECLRGALVIDAHLVAAGEQSNEIDDRRHELIGMGLADVIATDMFFRDHDKIGLGSGRGVYHTIAALSARQPSRARDISIISLTGSVDARDYSQRLSLRLEADTHAILLFSRFVNEPSLHLIRNPIAFADAAALADQRTATPISDANWHNDTPTHGIVGVGVFSKGHRLHDEAEAMNESRSGLIAPIAGLCARLKKVCSASVFGSDYCPVADLCNRLFWVPPPDDVSVDQRLEAEIRSLMFDINAKLLTVSERQLGEISNIVLVAAGRKKALAIKHLLQSTEFNIRFLATDRETAERIRDNAS